MHVKIQHLWLSFITTCNFLWYIHILTSEHTHIHNIINPMTHIHNIKDFVWIFTICPYMNIRTYTHIRNKKQSNDIHSQLFKINFSTFDYNFPIFYHILWIFFVCGPDNIIWLFLRMIQNFQNYLYTESIQ